MTTYLFFQELHWLSVYPSWAKGAQRSGLFVSKVARGLTIAQVEYVLAIRNIILPWTNSFRQMKPQQGELTI